MKIWTFYKKPTKEMEKDESIPLDVKYALYAITPKKKDAKIFEKSRNMDLFVEKVIDCDDDDGDAYLVAHRGCIIQKRWLETYRNKNTDEQEPYWINIALTENELNFTMECTDSGQILSIVPHYIPIEIFDKEMQEYLYTINYHKAQIYIAPDISGEVIHSDDIDFFDTGFVFDMFGVFMILYQSTISPAFFDYTEIRDEMPDEGVVY